MKKLMSYESLNPLVSPEWVRFFCGSDLFGKFRLSWVGVGCIGRNIMGIILLQEGIREEKDKFFFLFVLSEESDWEYEVYFDEHKNEELEDEL